MTLSGHHFNPIKIETVVPILGVSYIEADFEKKADNDTTTPNFKYFLINFPKEFLITRMHKIEEIIFSIEYGDGEPGWVIEVCDNRDKVKDLTLFVEISKVEII